MVQSVTSKINEEEAALYDRQIRLWGLDAQIRLYNFFKPICRFLKLCSANIHFVGCAMHPFC